MSTASAKWIEYAKLCFPDYAVDPCPTENAALLRSKSDPSDTFAINTHIITALSRQYNKGFDDGYADAQDAQRLKQYDDGDTDVFRDHVQETMDEVDDEIPVFSTPPREIPF